MENLPNRASDGGPDRHGCQHTDRRATEDLLVDECKGCGAKIERDFPRRTIQQLGLIGNGLYFPMGDDKRRRR